MEKVEQIKELTKAVQALAPEQTIVLSCYTTFAEVAVHNFKTYTDGTNFLRELGVGKREKSILGTYGVALSGELAEHLKVVVYCEELPPTCHKETYIEKVPKTQTVESGEFIEVKRERVVCSDKEDAS